MPQSDYYNTLQVKEDAPDTEIQSAYRRLLKKYDPHGSSPDPAKLREINEAYRVLSNPADRAEYDAQRASGAVKAPADEPLPPPRPRRRREPAAPADSADVQVAEEAAEAEDEAVPARPRRRRLPQAEPRPEPARRPRRIRVARTRFDRTTRDRLALLGVGIGVVVLVAILLLVLNVALPGQKRWDVRPRGIDIWTVYSGERVRYTALFYPASDNAESSVQMAGPLVDAADDITSTAVLGGAQSGIEMQPGPGDDSDKLFPMFTIARQPGGGMYGIDVATVESPYVTGLADGSSVVALGVELQNVYRQVIVAVAIPRDALVIPPDADSRESYPSYRNITLGEWQVYYYDTTDATAEDPDAIRITFRAGASTPTTAPDPYVVDRSR